MMESLAFPTYLFGKAVAYIAWCAWGLRLHGEHDRYFIKAVIYGIFRLALGALLGLLVIYGLVNVVFQTSHSSVLSYLLAYVPTRWVEWSFMAWSMDKDRSPTNFFVGTSAKSRLWRAGGIVLSCLADIPMMLALGGLPVGRFMC